MNVLIVEDEEIARNALSALLQTIGYATCAVASAELALEGLKLWDRPEIALVDLDLPGMNGAEFISRLANEQPGVFTVLITAASPDHVAKLYRGSLPHLRKPLDFNELVKVLDARDRSH